MSNLYLVLPEKTIQTNGHTFVGRLVEVNPHYVCSLTHNQHRKHPTHVDQREAQKQIDILERLVQLGVTRELGDEQTAETRDQKWREQTQGAVEQQLHALLLEQINQLVALAKAELFAESHVELFGVEELLNETR